MDLEVFTFSPAWGLPTSGPFPLKLVKWLDLSGLPYRHSHEDNAMKGPKGKSPWIVIDGQAMADSEIIIDVLAKRSAFDIERGLSPEQKATSHALRRMLEEHFHMIFEYELFVHPAGVVQAASLLGTIPRPLKGAALRYFLGHMKRQLHARGIARHDPETIASKGRADIDALESILGDTPYLFGEQPSMADVTAFGLVRPMSVWPMKTPVAEYVKSRRRLVAYLERLERVKAHARLAA
ncbi:MAG: glutathione S-transferase family protein [Devosia sp.]